MRRGYIHPYTPEMNLIEQIGREFRRIGLRNEVFEALDKVVVIILMVKTTPFHYRTFSPTLWTWICDFLLSR